MPAAEFDTAHLKVARAATHAKELANIWNEYLEPHPFDHNLRSTGPGEWILCVTQERPVPAELSIVFGEWLFDLRSALDSLLWATAVHTSRMDPPPGESQLQYPIYDTREAWDSNLRRLRPLAEHHQAMLLQMQPFNSPDPDANFLGWINRLARIDRHRRMTVATARVAVFEPVMEAVGAKVIEAHWGERVFRNGYCDVFRIRVDEPSASIRVNPRLGIDPDIEEWSASPFWGKQRFSRRMQMLQIFVQAEVALYEYDCTGESRGWDVISDNFRDESDKRRAGRTLAPIANLPRPQVEWMPAGQPLPSTAERLGGHDFPAHGTSLL